MRRIAFAILLAAACGDGGGPAETDGAPPGPPDTTASSTSGTPTSSTSPSSGVEPAEVCCEGSDADLSCSACSDGSQFCSALRFFGEDVTGDDYVCRDACVPTDAAAYWCADDTSCCDAGATCDPQGFCRLPDEGTTSGSSSGSDSSSGDTSSSSGDSTSSSSGGESSSSSSSTTGM